MTMMLLTCLLSGDCVSRVKVRAVAVQQVYAAPVAAQQYAYANAIYAYRVEDGEVASLRRQNEALTQAVVEQLRERTSEVQSLRSGDPTVEKQAARPDVPAILARNCSACHAGAKVKGEFTLPSQYGLAAKILIGDMVGGDKMPPNKKLTPDEKKAIEEWASPTRQELKESLKAKEVVR